MELVKNHSHCMKTRIVREFFQIPPPCGQRAIPRKGCGQATAVVKVVVAVAAVVVTTDIAEGRRTRLFVFRLGPRHSSKDPCSSGSATAAHGRNARIIMAMVVVMALAPVIILVVFPSCFLLLLLLLLLLFILRIR